MQAGVYAEPQEACLYREGTERGAAIIAIGELRTRGRKGAKHEQVKRIQMGEGSAKKGTIRCG